MPVSLDSIEVRVLGALLEKDLTTPEYYPLSLNALVNACNQKSNREPVVSYDDETVEAAVGSLRSKGLALVTTGPGVRVPKYSHRLGETLNFGRRELAVICELMLRGPQTLGELRSRTERMHRFDDLSEVEAVLNRLAEREPDPLAMRLPRQPGEKEARYAHLFSGEPAPAPGSPVRVDRISILEQSLQQLRDDLADLKQRFEDFRRNFE